MKCEAFTPVADSKMQWPAVKTRLRLALLIAVPEHVNRAAPKLTKILPEALAMAPLAVHGAGLVPPVGRGRAVVTGPSRELTALPALTRGETWVATAAAM